MLGLFRLLTRRLERWGDVGVQLRVKGFSACDECLDVFHRGELARLDQR